MEGRESERVDRIDCPGELCVLCDGHEWNRNNTKQEPGEWMRSRRNRREGCGAYMYSV